MLASELVVGDIVLLQAGDRVPADSILIEEMDMNVNQQYYFPDDSVHTVKQCSTGENHFENPDPILLAGSLIMSGSGKAVVCCVGSKTLRETELTKDEMKIGEEETPLMSKLSKLATVIGKWAYLCSAVAFTGFTLFFFMNILFGS